MGPPIKLQARHALQHHVKNIPYGEIANISISTIVAICIHKKKKKKKKKRNTTFNATIAKLFLAADES